MKLHHFVTKPASEEGNAVRDLGRALAQVVPSAPTVVQSLEEPAAPVIEAKKKVVDPEIKVDLSDKEQAHRDFALAQVEKSSPHVHRKIRQYD